MFSTTSGAAKLSLIVVIGLIVLKVVVAFLTGSISIIAQVADSFLDIFAVTLTYFLVNIAAKPADREHPFGHGKFENIGATVQALLLFAAGASIIYASVLRILEGATVELTEAGIAVMAVSIVASIFLSRHLLRVAKKEDSPALEANAHNIAADVYSASAVLIGLLVVRFTHLTILDPILAILVALLIFRVGYNVIRKSSTALIDVKLPEEEEALIKATILEHGGQLIGFHALRTRKSGSQRYIDLHLVMPRNASVEEAHEMTDHLEHDLKNKWPATSIVIHIEPCTDECQECKVPCDIPERKSR